MEQFAPHAVRHVTFRAGEQSLIEQSLIEQSLIEQSLIRAFLLTVLLLLTGCAASDTRPGLDGDKDGVPDNRDRCSQTSPGHPVTDQGCDLFERVLEGVVFLPGVVALDTAAREELDILIEELLAHPRVVLSVDAHTDNRGNARDNLQLSKKRVMSVVRYLVVKGINARRLRPYAYGESRPVVSNATASGRERNRRIEISVHSISEP